VKIIFAGTPHFAASALAALLREHQVAAVLTQPDRPSGRGMLLTPSPVKQLALQHGLAVLQPTTLKTEEAQHAIAALDADVMVVAAYGLILPKAVLEAPRRGCINLHASILPKYRGAAPITWAVVNGEVETGVSLMQMDEGMDTGPVLTIHRIPIGPDLTADELAVALGALAAKVVREDLARAVRGEIEAAPQDHAAASAAPMLEKEHGRIPWEKRARQVHDHVRGMTSWPGAFTKVDGKLLKVLCTRVADEAGAEAAPGTIVAADRGHVRVACGEGAIEILRAQVEGRKALPAADLVAGRTLREGTVLGG